jgi:hypothetical protein
VEIHFVDLLIRVILSDSAYVAPSMNKGFQLINYIIWMQIFDNLEYFS